MVLALSACLFSAGVAPTPFASTPDNLACAISRLARAARTFLSPTSTAEDCFFFAAASSVDSFALAAASIVSSAPPSAAAASSSSHLSLTSYRMSRQEPPPRAEENVIFYNHLIPQCRFSWSFPTPDYGVPIP